MKRYLVLTAAIFAITLNLAQISQAQTYTVLHTFTGGGDGAEPVGGVSIDHAGNLYGATYYGGQDAGGYGNGVWGSTNSTISYSDAVGGYVTATTGSAVGVYGSTATTGAGTGVYGSLSGRPVNVGDRR